MALHSNPRRHNLPAPLSAFIGRETEIAEVKDRLSAQRLLTLTGPGGCNQPVLAPAKTPTDQLLQHSGGISDFTPSPFLNLVGYIPCSLPLTLFLWHSTPSSPNPLGIGFVNQELLIALGFSGTRLSTVQYALSMSSPQPIITQTMLRR